MLISNVSVSVVSVQRFNRSSLKIGKISKQKQQEKQEMNRTKKTGRFTRQIFHPLFMYDPQALACIEFVKLEYFESSSTTVRFRSLWTSNHPPIHLLIHTTTISHRYLGIKNLKIVPRQNSQEDVF